MSTTTNTPTTPSNLSPQAIAEAVAVGMMAKDRATTHLGMRVTHISPGAANLEMTVREDMLNGHDTCHGGYITTLADSAFAFACNSYNELTVAASLTIDFIAPVFNGEVLTARAVEVSLSRRTGIYDVDVINQKGARVAVFRGRSHRIQGRQVVILPV